MSYVQVGSMLLPVSIYSSMLSKGNALSHAVVDRAMEDPLEFDDPDNIQDPEPGEPWFLAVLGVAKKENDDDFEGEDEEETMPWTMRTWTTMMCSSATTRPTTSTRTSRTTGTISTMKTRRTEMAADQNSLPLLDPDEVWDGEGEDETRDDDDLGLDNVFPEVPVSEWDEEDAIADLGLDSIFFVFEAVQ